jgi:hypothetical protein
MGRQVLILIVMVNCILLPSCQNQNPGDKQTESGLSNSESKSLLGPVIEFETTEYNFGRVYEGETVGWYFKFKNTGDKSLILTNVTASCGCTTPEYSKEPVLPGQRGEIKIVFDSKGRSGYQFKTVSVETNSDQGIIELDITAEIIKK